MDMDIHFSKPATYNRVKRISVSAPVRWDFPTTVLELVKNGSGWDVVRPAESAIWKADGTVIKPAVPARYFAVNLPLKTAKQMARELIETELWKE